MSPIVDGHEGVGSTLSEWMTAVMGANSSKQQTVSSLLLHDWQKIERLIDLHESTGLPIHHYLCLEDTHFTPDAPEIRTYFASYEKTRFAIRAIPRQPGLMPGRALDITREECFAYINHLSHTGGRYQIYLWEYFIPEFSGTIIVTTRGLYAEMVRGSHLLLTQQSVESSALITASLAFPQYHMIYSTDDIGARTVLWHAISSLIRKTCGTISPLSLPVFLKGYFEFSFHTAKGYRFFDYNTHPFIAQVPSSGNTPDILSE
jgi:hypothetical protein